MLINHVRTMNWSGPAFRAAVRLVVWGGLAVALFAMAVGRSFGADGVVAEGTASAGASESTPVVAAESLDRPAFAAAVDVGPVEALSVQHNLTLKTLDSYARQTLFAITGRSSMDGRAATYTLLDMSFRPQLYVGRNVIKVGSVPLRQDFKDFPGIDAAEKDRILKQGTVSLTFMQRADVQGFLNRVAAREMFKESAIGNLNTAANTLASIAHARPDFLTVAMVPPPAADAKNTTWKSLMELQGNSPTSRTMIQGIGREPPPAQAGYESATVAVDGAMVAVIGNGNMAGLIQAWINGDADGVNRSLALLGQKLPVIVPDRYPAEWKREAEVTYNKLTKLTLPGAAFYFVAFTAFLVSAYGGVPWVRKLAIGAFATGLIIHTVGIAIRWALVEKSVGNWFEAIPIKNQFESVLFSSWFGALVGLGLELWRKKGFFGAASAFVGWMSLVAIFSAPYVAGRDIGGEIHQAPGVLMSYWLYIHVTMATASYALIGMSFALGVWWLIKAVKTGVLFDNAATRGTFLATIDACNLVVLQLAFWILGVAIILGAIWADQSWGRPWGWDPKETFALVTWIVYLVVVHVRLATVDKAKWTAALSVIGFAIMLFNWVGVNFFLVGLHSYA